MISSLGFFPNPMQVKELSKFTPDDSIKSHLDYLQIPIIQDHLDSDSELPPEISLNERVLFCTPNTEEISNVAFYAYNDTEIFFHHDLFVFSTILDSCFIKDTLVATATFEPDIFLYDFLVDLPVLPQALLIGHSGSVTGVKNKDGRLLSCSEDKTVIEWDLNRLGVKERTDCGVSIEKFDFEGDNLVFGTKTYLCINNENIPLNNEIEQVMMKGNMVYVADSEGNLVVFDVRRPEKAMFQEKVHESAIVDLCLAGEWLVTTSLDKTVKIFSREGLKCEAIHKQDSVVTALGFDQDGGYGEIFAGTMEDYVFPIKLESM